MANPANTLALVGAGSLGQGFAALLAANGQAITVLSTKRTAERLLQAGVIRIYGGINLEIPVAPAPAPAGTVGITTDAADLPDNVGLIFTTKAQQLNDAIANIKPVWPRPGDETSWVAGVQNGMAKDRILAKAFGWERTVGAATIFSSQNEADGRVQVRGTGRTYLGEFGGGSSPRVEAATALLNQAGIPTTAAESIDSVLWTKASHAAGVFGITASTRSSLLGLSTELGFVRGYVSVIREAATIAAGHNIELGDYDGFPLKTYLSMTDQEIIDLFLSRGEGARAAGADKQYASMTQDVLAGRSLEVDEVFTDLVDRAAEANVPAPRITLLRDLLWGIDPGR